MYSYKNKIRYKDPAPEIFPEETTGKCLNCNTRLQAAFCSHCGQSSNTQRLSFKYFLKNDLHKGFWFLNAKTFRVIVKVIVRPGYTAKTYIRGKRVPLNGLIALIIVFAGLFLLVLSAIEKKQSNYSTTTFPDNSWGHFQQFVNDYTNWLILLLIPFMALASLLFFRRLRYNYSEHFYMNGIFFGGSMMIALCFAGIYYLSLFLSLKIDLIGYAIVLYLLMAYIQVFAAYYSIAGFAWRFIAALLCFLVLVLAFIYFTIFIAASLNN